MMTIPRWWPLLLLIGGCATIPKGPSVLVLPGTGKAFAQFQADDSACRQFAFSQATAQQPESRSEGRQSYDLGYIQCMYGRGHKIPVSGEARYGDRQDWHSPPPPNLPSPDQ
ncbi:hypothetical protein [Methylomagnum sp.]